MDTLKIILLTDVEDFILALPSKKQDKISGALGALENKRFESVHIKQLRGDIKELKVAKYRLLFFIYTNNIYVVRIFIKKSNKVPKNEIELAEKLQKLIINQIS